MKVYDKKHASKHSTSLDTDLAMNQNFITKPVFNPLTFMCHLFNHVTAEHFHVFPAYC